MATELPNSNLPAIKIHPPSIIGLPHQVYQAEDTKGASTTDARERLSILLLSTTLSPSKPLPTIVELDDREGSLDEEMDSGSDGSNMGGCGTGKTTPAEMCNSALNGHNRRSADASPSPSSHSPYTPMDEEEKEDEDETNKHVYDPAPSVPKESPQKTRQEEYSMGNDFEHSDNDSVEQHSWLKELSGAAELETISILYAKSILQPQLANGLGTRIALGCRTAQQPANRRPFEGESPQEHHETPDANSAAQSRLSPGPTSAPAWVPEKPRRYLNGMARPFLSSPPATLTRAIAPTAPSTSPPLSMNYQQASTSQQACRDHVGCETKHLLSTGNIFDQKASSRESSGRATPCFPPSQNAHHSSTGSSTQPVSVHPCEGGRLRIRAPKIVAEPEDSGSTAGPKSLKYYRHINGPLHQSVPDIPLSFAAYRGLSPVAKLNSATTEHLSGMSSYEPPTPEDYEPKFEYRRMETKRCNRTLPLPSFRHSIRVNEDGDTAASHSCTNNGQLPNERVIPNGTAIYCAQIFASRQPTGYSGRFESSSVKSSDTVSISSDSGQHSCSGAIDSASSSYPRNGRWEQSFKTNRAEECCMEITTLSYPKIAGHFDSILSVGGALISLAAEGAQNMGVARELMNRAEEFIVLVKGSASAHVLPNREAEWLLEIIGEARFVRRWPPVLPDRFPIATRKLVLSAMVEYVKTISGYLAECTNKERLLPIALSHLVRTLLFGGELSLEAIKAKAVENIVAFTKLASTPTDTLRMLLRSLAMLLGTHIGCLEFLSIGGLEVILHHLCYSRADCSMEAAGVLAQLTIPGHSFAQLNGRLECLLLRLLALVDISRNSESLLLCCAAIGNLSHQDSKQATRLLYQHNSILRLVKASRRVPCLSLPVQEQLATIFSRMASVGYEEALIAQAAIPLLLEMLTIADARHSEYCKRIRYKVAVCLGSISSTGIGLKAIFESKGYDGVCEAIHLEDQKASPLRLICSTIKQRIESTYEIESAV